VFGGSYGGMLAAWLRMKFPHTFQGALASSAPILFFEGSVSPYAYNEVATSSFAKYDASCPDIIRKGFGTLVAWRDTPENYAAVGKAFNMCTPPKIPAEIDGIIGFVNGALGTMAMVNYPYATDFINPMPPWPVNEACAVAMKVDLIDDYAYLVALQNATSIYYNYSG
jgi:lysosomal Pro-X carboxypeptidase